MSEHSVIVWDLETVPDLAAAARLLDMGGAAEADVREALGSGFPKHPLHKIACIGALVASRQPEGWCIDALGAPHTGERSEAQLIRDFIEKIGQLRPQLITFNGHSFDLPVLRYRAMVNRVPAAGLQVRQYFEWFAMTGASRRRQREILSTLLVQTSHLTIVSNWPTYATNRRYEWTAELSLLVPVFLLQWVCPQNLSPRTPHCP
jgi:predicted PolB exonuclease-like 3'-5' exonuclease